MLNNLTEATVLALQGKLNENNTYTGAELDKIAQSYSHRYDPYYYDEIEVEIKLALKNGITIDQLDELCGDEYNSDQIYQILHKVADGLTFEQAKSFVKGELNIDDLDQINKDIDNNTNIESNEDSFNNAISAINEAEPYADYTDEVVYGMSKEDLIEFINKLNEVISDDDYLELVGSLYNSINLQLALKDSYDYEVEMNDMSFIDFKNSILANFKNILTHVQKDDRELED